MRYAIFSDIHGNLQAWNRVLEDIRSLEVDVLVCLGDVVGYGPKPQEVLASIRQNTDNFVLGNHDAAAAGIVDPALFNDNARTVILWTRNELTEDSIQFLESVPLTLEAENILFVHAEITAPGRFGYIEEVNDAVENFVSNEHFVTFVGHTHHPLIFEMAADGAVTELPDVDRQLDPSCRHIINVGSVGEPRNPDDIRARYVVYDSDTAQVYFRRIDFDFEAYRADLRSTSLTITPYFLNVVDHMAAAEAGATGSRDMVVPAVATGNFVTARQLNVPQDTGGSKPKPLPAPAPAQTNAKPVLVMMLAILGLVVLSVSVGYFLFSGKRDVPTLSGDATDPAGQASKRVMDEAFSGTLGEGVILYAPLDETTGYTTPDASGNGFNLAVDSVALISGVIGSAFKFDGEASLLTEDDVIPAVEEVSISGWFKTGSVAQKGVETVFSVEDGMRLEFEGGRLFATLGSGVGEERMMAVSQYLRDNQWHHFVLANRNGTTELVVDGKLEGRLAESVFNPMAVDSKAVAIGSNARGADAYFVGDIDEVTIWNRGLNSHEMLALLKRGKRDSRLSSIELAVPGSPPPVPATPAPSPIAKGGVAMPTPFKGIGYWTLDSAGSKQLTGADGKGAVLTQEKPAKKAAILAPPAVPLTKRANLGASQGGIWVSSDSAPFELRADRSFTLEFWYAVSPPKGLSDALIIAGTNTSEGGKPGWNIGVKLNKKSEPVLEVAFLGGSKKLYSNAVGSKYLDGKPHYAIVTWNNLAETAGFGMLGLHLDGEKVAEVAVPHSEIVDSASSVFAVGGRPGGKNGFPGTLDEVRYSHGVLSGKGRLSAGIIPAPVAKPSLYSRISREQLDRQLRAGLRVYLPLNEGKNSKWTGDPSPQNNSFKTSGDVKKGGAGKVGGAYAFGGGASKSSVLLNGKVPNYTQVAISCWVKTKAPQRSILMSIGRGITLGMFERQLYVDMDGKARGPSRPVPLNDKWFHVVAQSNGQKTELFLNGKKVAEGPEKISNPHRFKDFRILRVGGLFNNSASFIGSLDEVAVWGRPLTGDEIYSLFETGNSGHSLLIPPKTVAYWKMDRYSKTGLWDEREKNHLKAVVPGGQVFPLKMPLFEQPVTGPENLSAAQNGTWAATAEDSKPFSLTPDQGFTVEGWFSTSRQQGIAVLAGNPIGGDKRSGWMVYLDPPGNSGGTGRLGFRVEGTKGEFAAIFESKDLVGDDVVHHFAATWAPVYANVASGKLMLFLDGKLKAQSANVPHGQILPQSENMFRLGTRFRGTLDEVRFTNAELNPTQFLKPKK